MLFRQVLHEDRSCASYVVGCPTLGVSAVVDPQGPVAPYVDLAADNGMVVSHVIETHVHADHVSSAYALADETGARLYVGSGADVSFPHRALRDGDVVDVGNRRIAAIATPGHTPEHVCLVVDGWFVLTGDTLFVGDVGRIDLALVATDERELRRRAVDLYKGLRRLLELPDETEVFPGHYAGSTCGRGMDGKPMSTIGRERKHNPALQLDLDAFVAFALRNLPPLPHDFETIKRTNGRSPVAMHAGRYDPNHDPVA